MSAVPAPEKLKQDDHKSEANLGYIARLFLNNNKKERKNKGKERKEGRKERGEEERKEERNF